MFTRLACIVVWAGLSLFTVLMTIAMALYPGGTWLDPTTRGYSFWGNYWSALVRPESTSGVPNPTGSIVATAGALCLVVAMLFFWAVVPELIAKRRPRQITRALGLLATAAMIPVSVTSLGVTHKVAIALVALPGFAALVLLLVLTRKAVSPLLLATGLAVLASFAVNAVLYAADVVFGIGPFAVTPATQKVATMLLLVWMLGCTITIFRRAS